MKIKIHFSKSSLAFSAGVAQCHEWADVAHLIINFFLIIIYWTSFFRLIQLDVVL